MKKIIFRLIGDKFPVSWELPLRNMYFPRTKDGVTTDKAVHYLKGSPSIWAEDYKGDKEPLGAVYFEDGVLEVDATDTLLLEILNIHRFKDVHYEIFDADANSEKKMVDFELKERALDIVNVVDDVKVKALALVLIGSETLNWTALHCRAELKDRAFTTPKLILDEAEKPNYEVKYQIGLSYLEGTIKDNATQTAVLWTDTDAIIIRLAVGENGLDKMTEFLSIKSEESMLTLQRLGEKSQKLDDTVLTEKFNKEFAQVDKKELYAKDAEIAELKRMLAEKVTPVVVPVVNENVAEKKEVVAADADDKKELTLQELQAQYADKYKKQVPNNKKTDTAWIMQQLQ